MSQLGTLRRVRAGDVEIGDWVEDDLGACNRVVEIAHDHHEVGCLWFSIPLRDVVLIDDAGNSLVVAEDREVSVQERAT